MSRPETTQEYALSMLRKAISSRELVPGQPVRQAALANQLGISRVPLREALKILEGEGHVTYEPYAGYRIVQLSLEEMLEVYDIRRLLETEVARRAIPNVTDAFVERARCLVEQIDEAADQGDIAKMAQANRTFHFTVFDAANTKRIVSIIRNQWDATEIYRNVYYSDTHNRARVSHEHSRIIDALARRDADQLVTELDEHRQHAIDGIRAVLNDE